MKESFGFRLKMLRKEHELTQTDLAKKLSIARSTLTNWEIGRVLPDLPSVARLADFFDVTVDFLLCRTNMRKPAHLVANIVDFLDGLTEQEKKSAIDFIEYLRERKK